MFVTYDTGNTTSFGLDHKDYIVSVKHKIDNVHIKDRTFQSETVRPFTGDTDFELIFNVLSSINYNQKYTLQAARQDYGNEIQTITQYFNIFKEMIDDKLV